MQEVCLKLGCLPPTLNEIVDTARRSKFRSAAVKKEWTSYISSLCEKLEAITGNIYVETVWYLKNFSRDPDNVNAAHKYIFDGLVSAGVIGNDNLRTIQSPGINWYEKSSYDCVTVFLRDKDAWLLRLEELKSAFAAPSTGRGANQIPRFPAPYKRKKVSSRAPTKRRTASTKSRRSTSSRLTSD